MAIALTEEEAQHWHEKFLADGFKMNVNEIRCNNCNIVGRFHIWCNSGCETGKLCKRHAWIKEKHYCNADPCQDYKRSKEEKARIRAEKDAKFANEQ
jgi:hypothetical protein